MIRLVRDDDATDIAEVYAASWAGTGYGAVPLHLADAWLAEHGEEYWADEIADLVAGRVRWSYAVAEQVGAVVGIAAWGPSPTIRGAAELHRLFVVPAAWGTGVGQELHDHALTELAELASVAVAWVVPGNDRAEAFLARNGWVVRPEALTHDNTAAGLIESRGWQRRLR